MKGWNGYLKRNLNKSDMMIVQCPAIYTSDHHHDTTQSKRGSAKSVDPANILNSKIQMKRKLILAKLP
jgi:hypothetical protein